MSNKPVPEWVRELAFQSYNWNGHLTYTVNREGKDSIFNPAFHVEPDELTAALRGIITLLDAHLEINE